ncbi:hypothetical protein [Thiobacillus denitrificans]|uniref:hypothetical protein n=1 Tax=Thiobacillus denitrificans TaxID=36861 RepID=UPI00037FEB2F|nr:hypothetical protein [Thiobacillus denitrificans]
MIRSAKILLALLAGLPTAVAQANWLPSPADMAALPPYCAARFNEGSDAFRTWRSNMGGDFIHVHHYCAGLNFLNRARGNFTPGRNDGLVAAVREFDYVLSHASPDFYLRGEILMNRGVALSLMKRDGEAVSNLLEAIRLDARQSRAYMTLADLYDKQKNRAKALETVSEGLRQNPGTRSLQRRYTELGGKLPYPEPAVAAAATIEAAKPAAEPAAAQPVEPAQVDTPTASGAPVAEPSAPPKIGSPQNPYCRFCPD